MVDTGCNETVEQDVPGAQGFRFSLVTADGSVVGECRSNEPLSPGQLVTVAATNDVWWVDTTLGHIARVTSADGDAGIIRVCASNAAGARGLAAEFGRSGCCGETPNGWVVYLAVSNGDRVATLTALVAAARRVYAVEGDVEFFVLDQGRPVRVPTSF